MKEIDFQLLPLDGRYFLTVALKYSMPGKTHLDIFYHVVIKKGRAVGADCFFIH